jgi:hypothetical protein
MIRYMNGLRSVASSLSHTRQTSRSQRIAATRLSIETALRCLLPAFACFDCLCDCLYQLTLDEWMNGLTETQFLDSFRHSHCKETPGAKQIDYQNSVSKYHGTVAVSDVMMHTLLGDEVLHMYGGTLSPSCPFSCTVPHKVQVRACLACDCMTV